MRMGVAYVLVSFSYVGGTPVAGALLSSPPHWNKAIIFSGVCHKLSSRDDRCSKCSLPIAKVTIIAGTLPPILVGRWMQARRKNTQYL
jgi:hypothetical protein